MRAVAEHGFVRCGEACPASSTHLIERPLLPMENVRSFRGSIYRGCAKHSMCRAGEGVRLPEIAMGASLSSCGGRHAQ